MLFLIFAEICVIKASYFKKSPDFRTCHLACLRNWPWRGIPAYQERKGDLRGFFDHKPFPAQYLQNALTINPRAWNEHLLGAP